MKKWNAPEVTELNISETASGDKKASYEYSYGKFTWINGKFEYTTSSGGPNSGNEGDFTS